MIPSWVGTIIVPTTVASSAPRPRKRSLANAKPASDGVSTTDIVTNDAAHAPGQAEVHRDDDHDHREHGPGDRGSVAVLEVAPELLVRVDGHGLELVLGTTGGRGLADVEQQRFTEQLERTDRGHDDGEQDGRAQHRDGDRAELAPPA